MRKLSDKFMDDLLHKELNLLLNAVINDDTLDLEIRDNYINIYYRGGNLYQVELIKGCYEFSFDRNYCNHIIKIGSTSIDFDELKSVEDYIDAIPLIKREMDYWFHENPKTEREYQQNISRENNRSAVARDTDYFIADIEYANTENGSRFDLVGIKWLSTSAARRNHSSPTLVLMEFKFGDNAITGTAGIIKHFQDMDKFFKSGKIDLLYSEVEGLFNQKLELGLVTGAKGSIKIKTSEKPEFLILCANHKPRKTAFVRELKSALVACPNILDYVNVKIASASHIGYGLYDVQMGNIDDYINQN